MARVDKTVFISYRRTNFPWALAIYQHLTQHGYDAFFDYEKIPSGDFESVILENIRSRAHFLVVLTPSALERCGESGDWLRREIEEAIASRRNVVPLMLEAFDFGAPTVVAQLTGKLESLRRYSGISVPSEYFGPAMAKLRDKFLNLPLNAIAHPPTETARIAAKVQQAAAAAAPTVLKVELTAQDWFERAYVAENLEEKVRCYNEAVRLKPDYFVALNNRGLARRDKGDLPGALQDFVEAIRLKPERGEVYFNRGLVRILKGDLTGALQDHDEAVRLWPGHAEVHYNRGLLRRAKGNLAGALRDFDEAIRLDPHDTVAYRSRSKARFRSGNILGGLTDLVRAQRLRHKPS